MPAMSVPALPLVADAPPAAVPRHSLAEDAQALVTATLFIALGVAMFQHAGLLTGGTAGIAFLIHYASGWDFGAVFFAVNLPFYGLAWRRMGRAFTFKTFAAVALLSGFAALLPRWVGFAALAPLYAAVMGGALVGMGLLVLFRHRASLGGVGIVALALQESRGWRAGAVQMAIDAAIVGAALWVAGGERVALSIVGALALNGVLAINHRPGRYVAQ